MKCAVVLLAVACSTRTMPDAGRVTSAEPQPALRQLRIGRHAGAIEVLAVTDDGRAVVSQDARGGTRLWPTLDGTQEPFIVALPRAQQLVLGRESGGFVVGAVDEAGGVELVRIAATGELRGTARLPAEPAVQQLVVAGEYAIALREDQTFAIWSHAGEPVGTLEPAFGEHALAMTSRGGKVLVVMATGKQKVGRFIAGTAWGETTPAIGIDPDATPMLSPDGSRLLTFHDGRHAEVDLATGKQVQSFTGSPLGFLDDVTVVALSGAEIQLWSRDGTLLKSDEDKEPTRLRAVADGIVVGAHGSELALYTPLRTSYLGYGFGSVVRMRAAPTGWIAIDGGPRPVVLDRTLAATRELRLPEDPNTLADVVRLDDRYTLALHLTVGGGWYVAEVLDLERHETVQIFNVATAQPDLRYEPSTKLLAISDTIASYLVALDATTKKFATWYRIEGNGVDLHVVEPRSGGLAAVGTHPTHGMVSIEELDLADLHVGKAVAPRRAFQVDGSMAAVDRAGHVYVIDGTDLVVYEHGSEIARIADAKGAHVVPNDDGAYIALWSELKVRLYDGRGALRWTVAMPLARGLAWNGDQLVIDAQGGIAALDRQTGAIKTRACGWRFGLSALPHRDASDGESICDAP